MNMKLILALFITSITSLIHAADPQYYKYEGEVAGVVCAACSGHVKAALTKIDGVVSVKITLGKEGAVPHLEVVSTSPKLTREAAVKALGEESKMYDIRSLKLASK